MYFSLQDEIRIQTYQSNHPIYFRDRLENNGDLWSHLLKTLNDLINWLTIKDEEIMQQSPVGGDLNSVKQQNDYHAVSMPSELCQTTEHLSEL